MEFAPYCAELLTASENAASTAVSDVTVTAALFADDCRLAEDCATLVVAVVVDTSAGLGPSEALLLFVLAEADMTAAAVCVSAFLLRGLRCENWQSLPLCLQV